MADTLDTAIADLVDLLDAISDPTERYQVSRETEAAIDEAFRGVRQRIARQLKDDGRTWREVGQIMGGVTAQRAEQISRGK